MNIYKFRVIIDTEEDIFRDIEIQTDATFLSLHDAIKSAFDFGGMEMASFYMSNETWDKGQEIPQEDMGVKSEAGQILTMATTPLSEFVKTPDEKLIFVYDFLRMWCFYIELIEIKKAAPSTLYPKLAMVFGDAPDEESKEMDLFGDVPMPSDFDEAPRKKTGTEEDYWEDEGTEDEYDESKFTSLDDLDEYI